MCFVTFAQINLYSTLRFDNEWAYACKMLDLAQHMHLVDASPMLSDV
jgi:glyceraldehyde-3-phosphate dehydrogenase/erythrose-4-phosphate dehydrogenase